MGWYFEKNSLIGMYVKQRQLVTKGSTQQQNIISSYHDIIQKCAHQYGLNENKVQKFFDNTLNVTIQLDVFFLFRIIYCI